MPANGINPIVELILWQLAYQSPWLLCCLTGILLAFCYRRSARRQCLLVGLACLILFVTSLVHPCIAAMNGHISRHGALWDMNAEQVEWLGYWLYILTQAVQGISLLILVAAALGGRPRSSSPPERSPLPPLDLPDQTEVLPTANPTLRAERKS